MLNAVHPPLRANPACNLLSCTAEIHTLTQNTSGSAVSLAYLVPLAQIGSVPIDNRANQCTPPQAAAQPQGQKSERDVRPGGQVSQLQKAAGVAQADCFQIQAAVCAGKVIERDRCAPDFAPLEVGCALACESSKMMV